MDSFIRLLTQRPGWVIGATLVFTVLIGLGLKDAAISSDFRLYFSEDNPQMQALEALEGDFNKQDNLIFLVNSDESVFAQENLQFIQLLVEKSWELPYARRVDSITNTPRTRGSAEELTTGELVPDDFSYSSGGLEDIRDFALQDTQASNYVSNDESVAVITVALNLPDDNKANEIVVSHARKLISEKLTVPEGLSIKLIGTAVINLALQEAVEKDNALLIPISYLVIFVGMYLLLRVWSGVALTLVVVTLTLISVFGGFVWLGGVVTPGVGAVPSMVLIIAVADCMHFLVSYYHYASRLSREEAISKAMKINFMPMLVTSVTTAIGLLCLNYSESPPYRDLGNIVAFGAIYAFLLTITLIPAALMLLKKPAGLSEIKGLRSRDQAIEKLGKFVSSNPYKLIAFTSMVVVVLVVQIPRNELSDNWEDYYDESFPVKQALNVQQQKLSGPRFIEYRVGSGQSQGIFDPAYMQDLDSLAGWLRNQPEVGAVSAFSDQVKTVYKALNEDDEEYFSIPQEREMLAQTILLYEMSLPFGMGLEERVDIDKRSTRLSVQLYSLTSKEIIAFDERVQGWVKENAGAISISEGTGLDIVFAHISQRNIESLVVGTILALVLISAILIVTLKSVKLGLISLVPNLVPAAMAYGLWGLLVGRIDLSVSLVGTMSLGLVVDDTIHFLSKYRHARTELGEDVYGAIRFAFSTVGIAMFVTSVVLAAGFAVLFFSSFSPFWGMGTLLAITILFALFVDFLLLPGLLVLFDRKPYSTAKVN